MTRSAALICTLFLIITAAHSQTAGKDTLSIHDGFFGMSFQQGDRDVSSSEFKNLLKSSPDTTIYPLFSSGGTISTMGDVLGGIGGFGLGYGITSKPSRTALTVAGGVVAVVGIFLNVEGGRKMQKAVLQYNRMTQGMSPHGSLIELDRRSTLVAFSARF